MALEDNITVDPQTTGFSDDASTFTLKMSNNNPDDPTNHVSFNLNGRFGDGTGSQLTSTPSIDLPPGATKTETFDVANSISINRDGDGVPTDRVDVYISRMYRKRPDGSFVSYTPASPIPFDAFFRAPNTAASVTISDCTIPDQVEPGADFDVEWTYANDGDQVQAVTEITILASDFIERDFVGSSGGPSEPRTVSYGFSAPSSNRTMSVDLDIRYLKFTGSQIG